MFSKGRRSIRLPGFDYSQPGFYFVTVCSYRRQPRFGRIEDEKVVLSSEGEIVCEEWLRTEMLRSEIQLDEYIIMPNHIHGIVIFNETSLHALPTHGGSLQRPSRTLGSLIARFKGSVTRRVRKMLGDPAYSVWQRNYYEHFIRSDVELDHIRQYIIQNPIHWSKDRYYC